MKDENDEKVFGRFLKFMMNSPGMWKEICPGCPTMISWDKGDHIPLHLITEEIFKCKSSTVYFFEDGPGDYNAVIGAKDKDDVIELILETFRMNLDMNENDNEGPLNYPHYGGLHPNDIPKIKSNITEWKEKFFSDRDHNPSMVFKRHYWD